MATGRYLYSVADCRCLFLRVGCRAADHIHRFECELRGPRSAPVGYLNDESSMKAQIIDESSE